MSSSESTKTAGTRCPVSSNHKRLHAAGAAALRVRAADAIGQVAVGAEDAGASVGVATVGGAAGRAAGAAAQVVTTRVEGSGIGAGVL